MWHLLLRALLIKYVTLLTNPEGPAPSAPLLTRQEVIERDAARQAARAAAAAAARGDGAGAGVRAVMHSGRGMTVTLGAGGSRAWPAIPTRLSR